MPLLRYFAAVMLHIEGDTEMLLQFLENVVHRFKIERIDESSLIGVSLYLF